MGGLWDGLTIRESRLSVPSKESNWSKVALCSRSKLRCITEGLNLHGYTGDRKLGLHHGTHRTRWKWDVSVTPLPSRLITPVGKTLKTLNRVEIRVTRSKSLYPRDWDIIVTSLEVVQRI